VAQRGSITGTGVNADWTLTHPRPGHLQDARALASTNQVRRLPMRVIAYKGSPLHISLYRPLHGTAILDRL
jgi:hypothetical protein